MSFSDHFSRVSTGYSEYRPGYPNRLYELLAQFVRETGDTNPRVWDCAAGTGQASVGLGNEFLDVFATDASASQIKQAEKHAHVHYAVATAEHCPLPDQSVSLVTVAQALHWFKVEHFYREVKRVLRPNGIVAVWCYGLLLVDGNRAAEQAVEHFCDVTVGPWWPPERKHIDAGYSDLPFPFQRITAPPVDMTASWTRAQMLGYLRTWSAVSRKRDADNGVDPVSTFEPILKEAWGDNEALTIRWPLSLYIGQ